MNGFKVFIYDEEMQYIRWLVLQRNNIETGGDLFGLWRKENEAVVQLVLGPGEKCQRTTTSFHQDVEYLKKVGEHITSSLGLCNVGEWHSHHRIDLPQPSVGDQKTVWRNISCVAGGRFLVFIANITGRLKTPEVNVNCFMFNAMTKIMSKGSFVILSNSSPLRTPRLDVLALNCERTTDWDSFLRHKSINYTRDEYKCLKRAPVRPPLPPRKSKGINHERNERRNRPVQEPRAKLNYGTIVTNNISQDTPQKKKLQKEHRGKPRSSEGACFPIPVTKQPEKMHLLPITTPRPSKQNSLHCGCCAFVKCCQ